MSLPTTAEGFGDKAVDFYGDSRNSKVLTLHDCEGCLNWLSGLELTELGYSADERTASSMDSKFGHLLQPIRDLAANWNVNVAEELEDYLVRLPVKYAIIPNASFECKVHKYTVHRAGGAGELPVLLGGRKWSLGNELRGRYQPFGLRF